jgi:hypothetical protein
MSETSTRWFTFGQGQAHHLGGVTYDPNIVVKITAPDPRARMFELFDTKWGMEYDEKPDLSYYSRGVKEL